MQHQWIASQWHKPGREKIPVINPATEEILDHVPRGTAADADLDAAIAKHRTGRLVIRTRPGAKVSVEQLKHDFWFGATLPNGIFSGKAPAEDGA